MSIRFDIREFMVCARGCAVEVFLRAMKNQSLQGLPAPYIPPPGRDLGTRRRFMFFARQEIFSGLFPIALRQRDRLLAEPEMWGGLPIVKDGIFVLRLVLGASECGVQHAGKLHPGEPGGTRALKYQCIQGALMTELPRGLNVEMIAREAGVSRATAYRYARKGRKSSGD